MGKETIESFGDVGSKKVTPSDQTDQQDKDAEQREIIERLKTIIRTISGKPNLEVTTDVNPHIIAQMALQGKDAEKEWFRTTRHDPETKEVVKEFVHVPREIVESNEDVAKGKAGHEAGHAAITRYGEFIPDEVMQELGFHAAMAAVEERSTDEVVRKRFEGAGKWVNEARGDSIKQTSAVVQGQEQLGSVPKFAQLCDLIVYAPHFDKIPDRYDPEVVKLYEKIRPHVERIEQELPNEGAQEQEVVRHAKNRYSTVFRKIWPVIKKLVEKDTNNEAVQQMAQQAMKELQQEGAGREEGGEPQGPPKRVIDQLPHDVKEMLKKMLRKMLHERKDQPRSTKAKSEEEDSKKPQSGEREGQKGEQEEGAHAEEGMGTPAPGQDQEGREGTRSKKDRNKEDSQKDESVTGSTDTTRDAQTDGTPAGRTLDRPPLEAMSPEQLQALKRAYEKLSKEQQQELREKAQKIFEELEDSIVKKLSGKLEDTPAETHEEHRVRVDEETRKKILERIRGEMGEIESRLESITGDKDHYEKVYQSIRELDEELYQRLEEIFQPNVKQDVTLKSSGIKVNLPAVFRRVSGKAGGAKELDTRIFETITTPDKKNYAITILVDLSSSMQGETIQETFKGVVLLNEVLNRLGITYELLGFQDEVIIFKRFDEDLTDEVREKISGMEAEAYDHNPGGHNKSNWNDDGPCLLEAAKSLKNQQAKEKFLLVLSDGMPAGRRSDSDDLTNAVEYIMKNTEQKLIGIGLGPDTEHVKKFYPTSLPNIDVKKLPVTFGILLEDIINNPQKYGVR